MKLYCRIKNAMTDAWYNFRARCQRFKRGYAYWDIWDMDHWFINTVKPMLIHLRDHGTGVPHELYATGADNERINWENILTEMIDCLDMMDEYNHNILGEENYLGIMEANKTKFFELFSKYFYDLWD